MRAIVAGMWPADWRKRVDLEADFGGIDDCPEHMFRLLTEMGAAQDIREGERRALPGVIDEL